MVDMLKNIIIIKLNIKKYKDFLYYILGKKNNYLIFFKLKENIIK